MRAIKLMMIGLLWGFASVASAAPTWQGTSVYNFTAGGNPTVVATANIDWQVYAPTDTGSPSAVAGYTYVYTLSNYTGGGGVFTFSIGLPQAADILAAGVTTPALAGTVSPTSGTTTTLATQWSFASPVTAGQTSGFYWVSSLAPVAAGASSGLISTVGTTGNTTALVMAPGAPEPATWALIFMAAGWLFFLYRRKEESVDEALVA